jgi:dTDP-glucose 4,6-dehydratase
MGTKASLEGRLAFVGADLLAANLGEYVSHVDRVAHLAAHTSVDDSWRDQEQAWRVNVDGTRRLLAAIRDVNLERSRARKPLIEVLYTSTEHVYGPKERGDTSRFREIDRLNPQNPYAASKVAGEAAIESSRNAVPAIMVRSSRMYGPGQKRIWLVPKLIGEALQGNPLPVYGQGQEMRDKLYVDDGVRGLDWAFHKGTPGDVYNISAGQEISNLAAARKILEAVGRPDGAIEHHPGGQVERPKHDFSYRLDSSKIREQLGWRPRVGFDEGLRRTLAWYRAHPSSPIMTAAAAQG